MSRWPLKLRRGFWSLDTGAAFSSGGHNLLAPAGAGQQWRLYAFHLALDLTAAAGAAGRLYVQEPAVLGILGLLVARRDQASDPPFLYPGGLALGANRQLTAVSYAHAVANVPLRVTLLYTLEPV